MYENKYNTLINLLMPYPCNTRDCQLILIYKELSHIVNAISHVSDWTMRVKTDSKVETGPESGLFWLRQLDRYPTISTCSILNFQCETAREVPLQGMGSMLNLDTFSWQLNLVVEHVFFFFFIVTFYLFNQYPI